MDATNNTSSLILTSEPTDGFQSSYRIVATALHLSIYIMGVFGSLGLMVVVYKSKTLHTPSYAYLMSLASADLLVIGVAVPEALVAHQIGRVWVLGQYGCAIFVFLNFLGINAGVLSLLAFTVERYVAVCRPLLARKICTLKRTRKIIVLCWGISFAYCAPWLGLTEVRQDPLSRDVDQCELRLTREVYEVIFALDLILFYLVPLLVAAVCHTKIVTALKRRTRRFSFAHGLHDQREHDTTEHEAISHYQEHIGDHVVIYQTNSIQDPVLIFREQTQRLRMLVVIVVLFAISWLPFRGLLLFNTFVQEPWLDLWYMLFAKSLIYINCAINPFLYNVLCQRFRLAVLEIIGSNYLINN